MNFNTLNQKLYINDLLECNRHSLVTSISTYKKMMRSYVTKLIHNNNKKSNIFQKKIQEGSEDMQLLVLQ